ncbi:S8 family serine peptidase [Kaarinaea lacus]
MKKRNTITLISTLVVLLNINNVAIADPGADAPESLKRLVANTVICKFTNTVLPQNIPAHASTIAQKNNLQIRHTYTSAFRGFSANLPPIAAEKLVKQNPLIEYCEPNSLVKAGGRPSGGGKGQGQGKGNTFDPIPQVIPQGVIRVGGPVDATGLNVWVIDSGVDLDNPDLNVDVTRGKDAVKDNGNGTLDDVYGHGTHVAGTLAAIDNEINVVGVAAGATIIPVRILKASDFGAADDAIAGIDHVAANALPGEVANMSAWWWQHNRAFHEAAYNLAEVIPFIVISGNDGEDLNIMPAEPAHVEHPNLITVSAVDHSDIFGWFSNYGYAGDWDSCGVNLPGEATSPELFDCATVDYAAPGVDVLSLQPDGSLANWWGTSMAAPHVAAIILLLQNDRIKPRTDGSAIGDPDSRSDPIVHR